MRPILAGICAALLFAGCSSVDLQTYAKPATRNRVFGTVQRVAVLPFDTLSEGAIGPKHVENILIQEIMSRETFERVEEPRYVQGLFKKLKLRSTEELDREIVAKMGQELDVDALVLGSLLLYGEEEVSEIVEFSVFLHIIEVETGEIIWTGSSYVKSSTTWGEVLGLSLGPSVNDLATSAIQDLADEIDDQFADARKLEYNLILESEPAPDMTDEGAADETEEGAKEPPEEEVEELLLKVKPK